MILLPAAPVLVPELSGAAWPDVEHLVDAGVRMLRTATSTSHDQVLVVAHGDRNSEVEYVPHNLRRWGAESVLVGPKGQPSEFDGKEVPGSVLMAWWWLTRAEVNTSVRSMVVAPQLSDETDRSKEIVREIDKFDGTVVFVADGPAALAPKAPIPLMENAVLIDRHLSEFIDGERKLPQVSYAEAKECGWYSQRVWDVIAESISNAHLDKSVHSAPFGVGYHVASWSETEERNQSIEQPSSARLATTDASALPTPIVIVGPTGTGKSDLALDLAEEFEGEIVNLDAMQLYKGMDVGTAKVPLSARRGLAHHMFDVLEVTETASVADYQRQAREAVESIRAHGKTPIVVGGSMMYYQSLLDEWDFPETDKEVRARYERRLEAVGVETLHAELAEKDPQAAASILPTDPRRTVRALEVIELTGKPFAASRPKIGRPRWESTILALDVANDELDARLEDRTHIMFEQGLVEEVRELITKGLRHGVTAKRAIGYAQVLEMLNKVGNNAPSTTELEEAIYRTFVGTRRYVRRQRSWFRRDERITWLDASTEAAEPLFKQASRIVRERA